MPAPWHGHMSASAPWSRLWRSGVAHSCATAMPGNYEGATLAFWKARLECPPDGGVVLDIGTGNGALAVLAMDAARARGVRFEVHGVDLADIDPPGHVAGGAERFAGIRFHPRTSFTALPFADGSVDLMCSQFAFEYAPREAATTEALRVLGARGGAAMVLHADDSVVARVSAQRLPWFHRLLHDDPLLGAAEAMAEVLAGARTPAMRAALAADARAEAARKAFNAAASSVLEHAGEPGAADVLGRFMPALSQALRLAPEDPARARQALASARDWLQDEEERLQQLSGSWLDADALAALAGRFRDAGHYVSCGSLEQQPGAKLGWTLEVAPRG